MANVSRFSVFIGTDYEPATNNQVFFTSISIFVKINFLSKLIIYSPSSFFSLSLFFLLREHNINDSKDLCTVTSNSDISRFHLSVDSTGGRCSML